MLAPHLYVHVPFCARRCSYCDFSIAVRRSVPVSDYLDGIRRELTQLGSASSLESPWNLRTVYLGGGTPSRLGGTGVASLLRLIAERTTLELGGEVTLEANPDDVTPEAVAAWSEAGVNRVSLGAQTFSDAALTWMHRTHDANQIRAAVSVLRSGGIGNVSLDLIFALPEEISRSWADDLDAAIDLSPDHISLYGLTVEPGTPLQRWTETRRVSAITESRYADEFLVAHERATAAGFAHYEVSNFAKPGRESRHNSAYWNGASYTGIGPSAHSFDGSKRSWNVKPYAQWLRVLESGSSPKEDDEVLDSGNLFSERAYLGLRTTAGYRISQSDRPAAQRWANAGWAVIEGDLVRLNEHGWLRLDSIAAGLTAS